MGVGNNVLSSLKWSEIVNILESHNTGYFNNRADQSKNLKIGIIGAGPAGLACAEEMRKYGYKVNDFPFAEKQSKRILTLPINPVSYTHLTLPTKA